MQKSSDLQQHDQVNQSHLRQEGIEPQNQLNMAIEQTLDLVYDAFSVDPAELTL